jgi:hypothetical protein
MARSDIDKHLRQLCRQANSLRDLGEVITSEEFIIGTLGTLLAPKGIVNGREKISRKKQVVESNHRSGKKRRVETIEGDWKETD